LILLFENISECLILSLSVNLRMSKIFFAHSLMQRLTYEKVVRYQYVKTVSYRYEIIGRMRFSAIDKSRLLS